MVMAIVRVLQGLPATVIAGFMLVSPASAQDGRAPETPKAQAAAEKSLADKSAEADVSRFCAAVAPSIAEARIAWQTKRLSELDAQLKQRIADLEKAEASARDWIAKRDALMAAANDSIVSIFSKMQPEAAAGQLSAMDDRIAVAILGKLKANAAIAILDEMEANARAASSACSRPRMPRARIVNADARASAAPGRARARRLLEQPERIHARTHLLPGRGRPRLGGDGRHPERSRGRPDAEL